MRIKIVIAFAVVLLVAGMAVAKATFTPVAGQGWMVAPPSGGDLKCIGGTPTGVVYPACTAGSKSQIRGLNITYRQEFRERGGGIDRLHTGARTVVFNANIDENGRGVAWGTWRVVLDRGIGEWEGTFTAFLHGWFGPADGLAVGHGTESEVDGMQLRLILSYEHFPTDQSGNPGIESDIGYRLDPKGDK